MKKLEIDEKLKTVDWSLIYKLVDRVATEHKKKPDGRLDRDEFTNFVKEIYRLKNDAPIKELFEKNKSGMGEDAHLTQEAFTDIMERHIAEAVGQCRLADLAETKVGEVAVRCSDVACCNCGGGARVSGSAMSLASNLSRGVLLWCVLVACAAHASQQAVRCAGGDPVTSLYFGTSTVSTCGYGDVSPAETPALLCVVLVQLWMMFGQQLLMLPWLCGSDLMYERNCGNPLLLLVTKLLVFCLGWCALGFCRHEPEHWTKPPFRVWYVAYFLTTTMSTVGYGDVFPKEAWEKSVVIAIHLAMLTMDLFGRSFDDVMVDIAARAGGK